MVKKQRYCHFFSAVYDQIFSYLQVSRVWMSSKFGQMRSLTTASKNRCHHFFSFAIGPIRFKFVGNEDMHNI